jgi:hypothetical protein
LPRCTGKQSWIRSYCSAVISMQIILSKNH